MTDINKWFEWFDTLNPLPMLALFVFFLFYFLRAWPTFPNWMIRPVIFLGGGLLFLGMKYGLTSMYLKGCIVSGVIIMFHRFIVCHAEKYLISKLPGGKKLAKVLGTSSDEAYLDQKAASGGKPHKPKAKI